MGHNDLIDEMLRRQRGTPLQTADRIAERQRRQMEGATMIPWTEMYPESLPPPVHGFLSDAELLRRAREYELELGWRTQGRPTAYKGATVKLFKMSALAQALGRKADTLRGWEVDGLLPSFPVARINDQRRYEGRQILLAQLIAHEEGLLDSVRCRLENTNFSSRVSKAWTCVPN